MVRELLRRLDEEGEVSTVFVDVEAAMDAADAVAELAVQAQPLQSVRGRIASWLSNSLRGVRENVEELGVSELKVTLRAGMDSGNWQRTGDQVFEALAANERPVVLAIDELPILVNRLLKGNEYRITPERRAATDSFMGWLRKELSDPSGPGLSDHLWERRTGACSEPGEPQCPRKCLHALRLEAMET